MKTLKFLFAGMIILVASCNNVPQKQAETSHKPAEKVNNTQQQVTKPLSGKVEIDSLPIQVKEFITQNYKGYTILNAEYDPLCSGADAIDVAVSQKNKPNYSLIFLPNGTFVQQEEDIAFSSAPENVLKSIKDKFSEYKIANQIEKIKLADNTVQYLFDISKNSIVKEVIIDEQGIVICESKE